MCLSQFGDPRGPLGWLAGKLMARGNIDINQLALEALDLQPGDHVLEIGFGPGVTLAEIAKQAGDGFVAGIEPSETMLREAAGRLKEHIEAGSVELKSGSVSSIPYEDGRFDRVLTVNTIYFWEQPESDLREVRRVLKPGGRFALVFRAIKDENGALRMQGVPDPPSLEELTRWMESAGFTDVIAHDRDIRFLMSTMKGIALVARAE